jgi:hypothetical protein
VKTLLKDGSEFDKIGLFELNIQNSEEKFIFSKSLTKNLDNVHGPK